MIWQVPLELIVLNDMLVKAFLVARFNLGDRIVSKSEGLGLRIFRNGAVNNREGLWQLELVA